MVKRYLFCAFFIVVASVLSAQEFISYFTGDTSDIQTPTAGGIVLMGGATENDQAMRWFLQRANGGDVVVIRTSGADGYNDYFFTELGVNVNSVESIVMADSAAAATPYIAQQVRNAEALWIAGGDQSTYVELWKNSPVGDAIRYLIDEKKAVVGGTSAGMAIQGGAYFSAKNGTITSSVALNNPFGPKMTLGFADFLHHTLLQNVVTDTHYDNPDRRGRHMAFLARLNTDFGIRFRGIACEEYTAVCIDSAGLARVFGSAPQEEDYAYFLQTTCETPFLPETCAPNMPLDWRRDNAAVAVCKISGTNNGSNTFSLHDWATQTGGTWENWWVETGQLKTASALGAPICLSTVEMDVNQAVHIRVSPNPAYETLTVELIEGQSIGTADLYDMRGQILTRFDILPGMNELKLSRITPGIYFLKVTAAGKNTVLRFCRM